MADAATEVLGLLVLDKPTGITSHTAVRRVARHFGIKRAGHAGTLDPLASGVLLVGLGRATRLLEYLVGHDKCYRAVIRLGESRDTLDREGRITETRPVGDISHSQIQKALSRFCGRIEQIPPVYSAIKVDGQPLYRRTRRGEEVQAPPRTVEITRLEFLSWEAPDLAVELDCSSGTYVRSLARDLGEVFGTGATLWSLVRLRSGPFKLSDAVSFEALGSEGYLAKSRILPPEDMVARLPSFSATEGEVNTLATGRSLPDWAGDAEGDVAVFDGAGRLAAIARPSEGGLRPAKVFATAIPLSDTSDG